MGLQPFVNLSTENFNLIQPYFVGRSRNVEKLDTICLHWTAGSSVDNDIKTLKRKGYGYHFIIDKEGKVNQGAPLSRRVGHAGNAYGPNKGLVNTTSIGISFSMLGTKGNDDFNQSQLNSLEDLILDLREAVPTLKWLTGHHWVSPGRKIDPYTFPFDEFISSPNLKGWLKLWKTGYEPFPEGLSDCKCIEKRSDGSCKKSKGSCTGPGDLSYSERKLSKEVSDLGFQSDKDTP